MSTIVGTNIEVTNIKFDSDTTSMIISNAGQVTIQGEGSATTNLQQGLCKAWQKHNTSSVEDSLNASTFTDNATGDFTVNFTNSFNNAHHCCGHMMGGDGGNNFADARIRDTNTGTGSMRYITGYNDTSLYDWGNNALTYHGDLA
tara:strand:+ start:1062 stop:1496 length:435 start_codon:yes stop_codon:yes gene_type:complete